MAKAKAITPFVVVFHLLSLKSRQIQALKHFQRKLFLVHHVIMDVNLLSVSETEFKIC